jgi:hypothetical protein
MRGRAVGCGHCCKGRKAMASTSNFAIGRPRSVHFAFPMCGGLGVLFPNANRTSEALRMCSRESAGAPQIQHVNAGSGINVFWE